MSGRPWHRSQREREVCAEIHDGTCPHEQAAAQVAPSRVPGES